MDPRSGCKFAVLMENTSLAGTRVSRLTCQSAGYEQGCDTGFSRCALHILSFKSLVFDACAGEGSYSCF